MSKTNYTGHHSTNMPDGKTLVDWITPTVDDECRFYGVEPPNKEQMAVVISALRMHKVMAHAAQYDFSETWKPNEKTKYWPMESSVGRYFRDAARVVLDEHKLKESES